MTTPPTITPARARVALPLLTAAVGVLAFCAPDRARPEVQASRTEPPSQGHDVQASPGLEEAMAAKDALAESEPEGRFVAAARAGDVDEVRRLLAEGLSPNAQESKNGHLALHQAARTGSLPVVELLLDAGADVNAPDGNGMTPLMQAAVAANVPVGRRLLRAGADPDAQPEPKRQTALSQLVGGEMLRRVQGQQSAPERVEFARLLFDHGADPNAASKDGPPIRAVIALQDAAILALFLEHGAQVSDLADIQVFQRMPGPVGEMLRKAIPQEP